MPSLNRHGQRQRSGNLTLTIARFLSPAKEKYHSLIKPLFSKWLRAYRWTPLPRKKRTRNRKPRKKYAADLHMHSTCSDGQLTPIGLVELAARRSIKSIAITDHDTVDAFEAARAAAKENSVALIPGVEISALDEREVHILGYFFDHENAELQSLLAKQTARRIQRIHEICERLLTQSIEISSEEVLADCGGNAGRPHVARALLKGGHVSNFQEAFTRYLGRHGSAYVPKALPNAEYAIDIIHRAGGVASLAHPGVDKLTFTLHRFKEMGVDSVEINHPAHRPVTKRELQVQVTRLNLLTSGGSDMHEHKGASIIGAEGIDTQELAALEMKANNYRKQNGMAEYVQ